MLFAVLWIMEAEIYGKGIFKEFVQMFGRSSERLIHLSVESNCFYELFSEITSEDFMSCELIGIKLSEFAIGLIRTKKKENEKIYAPCIKKSECLLIRYGDICDRIFVK